MGAGAKHEAAETGHHADGVTSVDRGWGFTIYDCRFTIGEKGEGRRAM